MFYAIRHFTSYRYNRSVWQSMMEVRMHPRSEGNQRCFVFRLSVNPISRIFGYTDSYGNLVHHFDLPSRHSQLTIISDALVNIEAQPSIPEVMEYRGWQELEELVEKEDYWDMLMPSHFARSSPELEQLAGEIGATERKGRSPLAFLWDIASGVHRSFSYVKKSTAVNSPIEDTLRTRQGVCQDFAHIMIALVRRLQIPCRYVSGYMFHRNEDDTEKDRSLEGASHAWIEALVPGLGWVAFDPTNNLVGGDRHIRVAIGRDYADVPPTRGVHKGEAQSTLSVAVTVSPSDAPPPEPPAPSIVIQSRPVFARLSSRTEQEQQQQQ